MSSLTSYLRALDNAKAAKSFRERAKWERRAQQVIENETTFETSSEDDYENSASDGDEEPLPKKPKSWVQECSDLLEKAQQAEIQQINDSIKTNEQAARARLHRLQEKRRQAEGKLAFYNLALTELERNRNQVLDEWRTKKRLLANLRLEDQIHNRNIELLTTDWSGLVDKYVKYTLKMRVAQLKIDKWNLFSKVPDYPSPEALIETDAKNKQIEKKTKEALEKLGKPKVSK